MFILNFNFLLTQWSRSPTLASGATHLMFSVTSYGCSFVRYQVLFKKYLPIISYVVRIVLKLRIQPTSPGTSLHLSILSSGSISFTAVLVQKISHLWPGLVEPFNFSFSQFCPFCSLWCYRSDLKSSKITLSPLL